jgi:hypothetical protein
VKLADCRHWLNQGCRLGLERLGLVLVLSRTDVLETSRLGLGMQRLVYIPGLNLYCLEPY